MGELVTSRKVCNECPYRKDSAKGWLGKSEEIMSFNHNFEEYHERIFI